MMTTIGIAQWRAQCGAPQRNLEDALELIEAMAGKACDLLVLPELWPCGYDPETLQHDAADAAEPIDGPRGRALAAAARRHAVWLFAGTVPERDGDDLYNTALVYAPDGTLRAAHRKAHLYTPLGEDLVFSPGVEATTVMLDGIGTVGISTCFDGDHPEYARRLLTRGARIVVAPCAYETGAETWWELLYPANALVNGQWWLMANQSGRDLLGRSRVIAPDGSIRAEASRVGEGTDREILVVRADLHSEIARADIETGALRT